MYRLIYCPQPILIYLCVVVFFSYRNWTLVSKYQNISLPLFLSEKRISINLFKTRIDQEYVHVIRNWHNILKSFTRFLLLYWIYCFVIMRWVAIWRINHVVEKVFCYYITISWNYETPSSDRVILQILEAYYLQFNAWYALFQSMISVLQNEMVVVFF